MKICHVCNAECDDSLEFCSVCGAELNAEDEVTGEIVEVNLKNPVLAVSVEDVVTAEIYRDVLKENNIPFTCDSEEQGSMKLLFGGGFVAEDIYVDESDLDRAKQLYDEVVNSEPTFEEFEFEGESDFTEFEVKEDK